MKQGRLYLVALLLLASACRGGGIAHGQSADTVGAWGNNEHGQATVPLAAQSNVTGIAAGSNYTVALKTDGSVVAWGNNKHGQATVPLAAQSDVTGIATGNDYTVALKKDGSVLAWGNNEYGQTTVPFAAQSGVKAVGAGAYHTVVLMNDGSVLAWGGNSWGQTTVPAAAQSEVAAIAAGDQHTVALKNDGSVVAWGDNQRGQTTVPGGLNGVTAIAAGGEHTVALKNDGSVVAWGSNQSGQTTVPVAARREVKAIAAGWAHTVALKTDGTVVAWGDNFSGQVTGSSTRDFPPFSAIASPLMQGGQVVNGVTAIAAGAYHTVVLVTLVAPAIVIPPTDHVVNEWRNISLTVVAAGFPLSYQWRNNGVDLVEGTNATYDLLVTTLDQAGSYTVQVSNSAGTVISKPGVLTVNPVVPGSVVVHAESSFDQSIVPVSAQSGVTAIALGPSYSVALKDDGSIVTWGDSPEPRLVASGLNGVAAVAAGDEHIVASKNDGAVVAWGNNSFGQVTGIPTDSEPYQTASPVILAGRVLSNVKAISTGSFTRRLYGMMERWPRGEEIIAGRSQEFHRTRTRGTPFLPWQVK